MATRLGADQRLLDSQPSGDRHAEARCHLFGLEALLRAHIEREERFLIPLLVDSRTLDDQAAVADRRQAPIG